MLLFLTNFSGIVVIAVTVFVIFGATPSREMINERHRLRNGFIVAIFALVVIALPLVWHGVEELQDTIRSTTGAPIVRSWIGGRDLTVTSWSIRGDDVTINLSGPDVPASVTSLADSLSTAFGVPVQLEVDYVPSTRQRVTGTP